MGCRKAASDVSLTRAPEPLTPAGPAPTQRGSDHVRQGRNRRDEPVAQPVEHLTFNQGVLGSSPSGLTTSEGLSLFRKTLATVFCQTLSGLTVWVPDLVTPNAALTAAIADCASRA